VAAWAVREMDRGICERFNALLTSEKSLKSNGLKDDLIIGSDAGDVCSMHGLPCDHTGVAYLVECMPPLERGKMVLIVRGFRVTEGGIQRTRSSRTIRHKS
jgi:hypothetical protein